MILQTFCRYEKKVLVDESILDELIERLTEYAVPDKYNKHGKPYPISTLYFDNDNNDIARLSESKPSYKVKLRVRSYTVPKDDDPVFIELKRKIRGVGVKRRAKMCYADVCRYLRCGERPAGLSYLDGQVLSEIDYFISLYHPYPKMHVSYERYAFTGRDDPRVRITIDSSVLVRRDRLHLSDGRDGTPLLPPGKVLMEVKIPDAVPVWLAHIMSEFGLSFGSFSKYGNEYRLYLESSGKYSV